MPAAPPTPPPHFIGEGLAYTVRRIISSCVRGRGLHYLVDLEGHGPKDRSWVPARHVLDRQLVRDFHQQHPDQPSHSMERGSSCHGAPAVSPAAAAVPAPGPDEDSLPQGGDLQGTLSSSQDAP